jgi:hypothetical protein
MVRWFGATIFIVEFQVTLKDTPFHFSPCAPAEEPILVIEWNFQNAPDEVSFAPLAEVIIEASDRTAFRFTYVPDQIGQRESPIRWKASMFLPAN